MTKIEKVLEKFRNEIYWIATTGQPFTVAEKINIEKDAFKKVAQDIFALIPGDKETSVCKYSEEQNQGYVVEDVKMVGYNLALADVRRAMGGEGK